MSRRRGPQIDLFGGAPEPAVSGTGAETVEAAAPTEQLRALGAALPATLHLGTSSWAFPGWAGLVYARRETTTRLSRHGLTAYAAHPLLRAVGVDRTFYAPIAASDFAEYAAAVPEGFRFLVKAHADLTTPGGLHRPAGGRGRGAPSADRFLDAAYATDAVVGPAVEGLGDRLGVLLFQFPPLRLPPRELAALPERMGAFLQALPAGVPYAVEVRNAALLGVPWASALREGGATHCYTVHPQMPGVLAQREQLGPAVEEAGPVAVRWMLRPDQQYQAAKEAWAPFDELVAPDLTSRAEVAALLQLLTTAQRRTIVIANNKAEGSAPRTLTELARQLVGRSP